MPHSPEVYQVPHSPEVYRVPHSPEVYQVPHSPEVYQVPHSPEVYQVQLSAPLDRRGAVVGQGVEWDGGRRGMMAKDGRGCRGEHTMSHNRGWGDR